MWTRRIAFSAAVLGVTAAFGTPAIAGAPVPRGPAGGCGAGFALVSVADMQAQFPDHAAFFAGTDTNKDGYICNRFSPPQLGGGVAVDNRVVGRT